MPNGFHGPQEEWQRMEAPYIRIDPILEAFAKRHGLELHRNYRDADRSLRWTDTVTRAIWIGATDKYGSNETYHVSVAAQQDRPERYAKHSTVAESIATDELERALEEGRSILASWSESDLQRATMPSYTRGAATIKMAALVLLAWIGMLIHNLADLPITFTNPQNTVPALVWLVAFVVWALMPERTWSAVPLLSWATLNLIGAVVTVLPLSVLPFAPEQSVRHYSFHALYLITQLPVLRVTLHELAHAHDRALYES